MFTGGIEMEHWAKTCYIKKKNNLRLLIVALLASYTVLSKIIWFKSMFEEYNTKSKITTVDSH